MEDWRFKDAISPGESSRLLLPRSKPSRGTNYGYRTVFQTQIGLRFLPRLTDPPSPTSDTMEMARQGRLTDPPVLCASNLVGNVSPQTAKINLDHEFEYQTREFSDRPSIPDSKKSLRNLFYLVFRHDELPSYHFWISDDDPNPLAYMQLSNSETDPGYLDNQEYENDNTDLFVKPSAETSRGLQKLNLLKSSGQEVSGENQNRILAQLNAKYQKHHGQDPSSRLFLPGIDSQPLADKWISQGENESCKENNKRVQSERSSNLLSQNLAGSNQQSPGAKRDSVNDGKSSRHGSIHAVDSKASEGELERPPALIRCQRGGVWLNEFSHIAFRQLAHYVVYREENDTEVGTGKRLVDVLRPGEQNSAPHTVDGSMISQRAYPKNIKPFLGLNGYYFRFRSDAYGENSPWDESSNRTIKLTRVNFGYCYVNAVGNWNCATNSKEHRANCDSFEDALDFLFGLQKDPSKNLTREEEQTNRAESQELTLRFVPEGDDMTIDRSSKPLISLELGRKLEEKANCTPIPSGPFGPVQIRHQYSAEVFVRKTGEEFVHPLTERVRQSSQVCRFEEQQNHEAGVVSNANPATDFEDDHEPSPPSNGEETCAQPDIEQLKRQLKSAEDGLLQQVQQSCQVEQERDQLQTKVKILEEEKFRLRRVVMTRSTMKTDIEMFERRLDVAKRGITKQVQRAEGFEQERDRLRINEKNLDEEILRLRRAEDRLILDKLVLQEGTQDLRDQCLRDREKAKQNDGISRATIGDLQSEISRLEEVDRTSRATNEDLQREVSRLEEADGTSRATNEDLQREVSRLENENRISLGVIKELNSEVLLLKQTCEEQEQKEQPPPRDISAPAPNPPDESSDPKKLLYCISCIKSVDKLDENVRSNMLV